MIKRGMGLITNYTHDSLRAHALWRVQYRRSVLQAHRATSRSAPDWLSKEAELESWLQEALEAWRCIDHEHSLIPQI